MKYAVMKFDNYYKEYIYKTDLDLIPNVKYDIVVDGEKTYENHVTFIGYINNCKIERARTITQATPVELKRPNDGIKEVFFNREKRTTCVLWTDGTKTVVHCQPGDYFDEEKALALCYMKRAFYNRGCFNETLKKWCN